MRKNINVGVIGGSSCTQKIKKIAFSVGSLIARQNWTLICGGGSGVMEAACQGARENKGVSVGILPSDSAKDANPYVTVAVPTGIGYVRNFLVVRASDYLVAIDGKYGTLSEIAFALNEGKKVIGIGTWKIPGIVRVQSAQQAIQKIKDLAEHA